MKISISIIVFVLLFGIKANAQIWDELFNQKKTQTKYLLEQIAALQVYIGHIEKSYQIAKDGLTFISKAGKGEFDLHDDYFNSLKAVNPEVANSDRVKAITELQKHILKSTDACKTELRNNKGLRSDELSYVDEVFSRVLINCGQLLDELNTVLSYGKLEMKDDERIARIDAIHLQMQDNFTFVQSFGSGAASLALSRNRDQNDLTKSKILNNTNK